MISVLIHKDICLNSNQRLHYMERARRVRELRVLGHIKMKQAMISRVCVSFQDEPVDIVVSVTKKRGRFDAPNYYPTVKAVLDGFVDAGLLNDDSNKYVSSLTFKGFTDKSMPDDVVNFSFSFERTKKNEN